MALTTLAQVKAFLGIPSTNISQDPWLDSLRSAAEEVIQSRCGRRFESQTYTDYLSGNNTRLLPLRQRPVTAVASVYLDFNGHFGQGPSSPFSSVTLLTQGVDYSLYLDETYPPNQPLPWSRSGLLIHLRGNWPTLARYYLPKSLTVDLSPAFGNIKVTYTAGYLTIPTDIQYAVAYLVSWMRRNIPVGGPLESETIGDYMYRIHYNRFPQDPELGSVEQVISRYREVPF